MGKRISSVLLVCVMLASLLSGCAGTGSTGEGSTYADKIFDQSYVHEINVVISDEDWTDLKTNPLDKTKYEVNVEIDGEEIDDVSFATKGNTSLSSVASDADSDRYSFKINFGKFVDGQTYYGLDKLNLNNIYADATYMKDYISYQLFRAIGVNAPLASYVELKINGESFGLYLALEEVGESYLERNGDTDSILYKPETEQLDNMDKADQMQMPDGENMPDMPVQNTDTGTDSLSETQNAQPPQKPDGQTDNNNIQPSDNVNMPNNMQMPEGMEIPDGMEMPDGMEIPDGMEMPDGMEIPDDIKNMGGFGDSSSGAALLYTDDNIESYSDIFDNAVTDVTEDDENRVIAALKELSEGDAEDSVDVSEVIDYFAVHNFVMNYDSYTGNMLHNYYLMETNGKLSMIPWDYNLAFGAFSGGGMGGGDDATALVNCGIDSPLSGASESDRPMWAFITSSEDYLNRYHESCEKLVEYINSGELENEMNRVYEMIHSYVENDNSAFYTVDEFETAYNTLLNFCKLRAESISKQLDGTLATVTDSQNEADRVDASSINISDMGSQNKGKGDDMFQNMFNNMPNMFANGSTGTDTSAAG